MNRIFMFAALWATACSLPLPPAAGEEVAGRETQTVIDDTFLAAQKAIRKDLKAGFELRDESWSGIVAVDPYSLKLQLFKGNEYLIVYAVDPVTAAGHPAVLTMASGKEVIASTTDPRICVLRFKPTKTGTYVLSMALEGKKGDTTSALAVMIMAYQ